MLLKGPTEAQVLVATEAAGEGVNLQFCRLMVNWGRLEGELGLDDDERC